MSQVTVARLKDVKYMALRSMQRLFHDAFKDSPIFPQGFEGMLEDVLSLIVDPWAVILVGVEDDVPKALSIVMLPRNRLAPVPQIMHFYNGGGLQLRKKLTKATAEVVKGAGYTTLWVVNATGKPDSVWARMFSSAGTARPLGGVIELDLAKGT